MANLGGTYTGCSFLAKQRRQNLAMIQRSHVWPASRRIHSHQAFSAVSWCRPYRRRRRRRRLHLRPSSSLHFTSPTAAGSHSIAPAFHYLNTFCIISPSTRQSSVLSTSFLLSVAHSAISSVKFILPSWRSSVSSLLRFVASSANPSVLNGPSLPQWRPVFIGDCFFVSRQEASHSSFPHSHYIQIDQARFDTCLHSPISLLPDTFRNGNTSSQVLSSTAMAISHLYRTLPTTKLEWESESWEPDLLWIKRAFFLFSIQIRIQPHGWLERHLGTIVSTPTRAPSLNMLQALVRSIRDEFRIVYHCRSYGLNEWILILILIVLCSSFHFILSMNRNIPCNYIHI